jgi:hypothetical protein
VFPKLTWLDLGLLAVVWLTFGWLYRRARLRRLPEISDREFLRRFSSRFAAPPARVLTARRRVAKVLGLPEQKLSPEYKFDDLARRVQLLGDFGMGWDNLIEEVGDAASRAGLPRPEWVETVGDLVAGLIQAPAAMPPQGRSRSAGKG